MSRKLSMSRMHAAYACGYAFRQDVETRERASGREARIGSLVHRLAECHVKRVDVEHDNVDPAELAEALAIFNGPLKAWLDSRKWTACEIGLRYNAENDNAVIGPRRGEEGYDAHGPHVLKGTLDLVEANSGIAWIFDLKTGKKQNAHPEQLYAQAVGVTRLLGLKEARVGFLFARKTKCDEPQVEVLDADRLDYEAGRIRRLLRTIPTARPETNPACVYCPAWGACPLQQRAPIGADNDNASAF